MGTTTQRSFPLSSQEKPVLIRSDADNQHKIATASVAASVGVAAMIATPSVAEAATAGAPNALASAFGAYGHFASILVFFGALLVERTTIKPNMTAEEEDTVAMADILLGVFGAILAYTGYLRAVSLEKGWDFYAHEPIFWVKMLLTSIWGASSFFTTTIVIQRSLARRKGKFEPMGEKLASRLVSLTNVGVLAMLSIPLTATLMARGIGYNPDFPWPAGAGVAAVALVGLGFKYIKEAMEFEDDGQNGEKDTSIAP